MIKCLNYCFQTELDHCNDDSQTHTLTHDTVFYSEGFDVSNIFPDDGLIDQPDLREVMRACMVENGMHFDEKEVSDLANALFDDAVKVCVIILNMQMCKTKRNI